MKFPVIGFAGRAGTGKDAAASFAIAAFGGYRYAFADPVRAMLRAGFGLDLLDPYWQTHKEDPIPAFGGKSPRQLMQTLGTEWGQDLVHPHIWVILATGVLRQRGRGMVVSDVRFEHEARWVRTMGGLIVHIDRPAKEVNAHRSEDGIAVAEKDAKVSNTGTLDEYQKAVIAAIDGSPQT